MGIRPGYGVAPTVEEVKTLKIVRWTLGVVVLQAITGIATFAYLILSGC